jgi:hypothetical protein
VKYSDDGRLNLKACPFCGGEARIKEIDDRGTSNDGGRYIECQKCWCSTSLVFPLGEPVDGILAEKWNARAPRKDARRKKQ